MKTNLIILILTVLFSYNLTGQIENIADNVLLLKASESISEENKKELDTLWKVLKFYREFEREETKLNGKATFGFAGNESELNNIFNINAGVKIDNGIYPYELDLNSNFQTIIQNGEFQENVSDIDISFDYHPKIGNGLFLETFVFLTRFNNNFLSIDQRYEAGTGVVFNFFSSKKLTPTGEANSQKLKLMPEYKSVNGSLWKCYDDACRSVSDNSSLALDASSISHINNTRFNFEKGNIKRYSKVRIALMIGFYYENEKARLQQYFLLSGMENSIDEEFAATNKLRLQVRPTFVYRPNDVFTLKFYPYFKLPLRESKDLVRFDDFTFDERIDKFYDFQSSITATISNSISISIIHRYLKDFAPKRKYVLDANNDPNLVVGQKTNSYYYISFGFGF